MVCVCLCVHSVCSFDDFEGYHVCPCAVFIKKSIAARAFCFPSPAKSAEMDCIDRQRGQSKQSP